MGQVLPNGRWVRSGRCGESSHYVEIYNEGDGIFLVRSSMNRDRTLRLTQEELHQLADIALWPSRISPAPELVTR